MKHKTLQKNKLFLSLPGMVFVVFFVLFVAYMNTPQKTSAFLGGGAVTVVGGPGTEANIQNVIVNSQARDYLKDFWTKEFKTDPKLYKERQAAIKEATSAVINEINSGFEGDPAFITNLEEYKSKAKAKVAGTIIENEIGGDGGAKGGVCEAFRYDVVESLLAEFQEENATSIKDQVSCTLETSEEDTKAFLEGDFSKGGWKAFKKMVLNPENTPIGSKLANKERLEKELREQEENLLKRADWANGYKDIKVCAETETVGGVRDTCTVTTPGILIQEQLALVTGLPLETLALGPLPPGDTDEPYDKLYTKLSEEVITGTNGILGLGGNPEFTDYSFGLNFGFDFDLSFLEALQLSNQTTGTGEDPLATALENAQLLLEFQLEITSLIDDAEETFTEASATNDENSCWNLDFPSFLTDTREAKLEEIPLTIATILALEVLMQEFENDNSRSGQTAVMRDLIALFTQDAVPDESAITEIESLLLTEVTPAITELEKAIKNAELLCN